MKTCVLKFKTCKASRLFERKCINMIIRIAKTEDIPDLLVLLRQVALVHRTIRPDLFTKDSKYSTEELEELLKDPERPIFVAAQENTVLGYAFLEIIDHRNDGALAPILELYVDDLCVDENHRHMGVASALFERVCEFAKETGCAEVTLNVWEGNVPAMAFYRKMGMKPQKTKMERKI